MSLQRFGLSQQQIQQEYKMDKKILIIIVLGIIILIGIGVYAYNQISDKAYTQGIQDASLIINQQILNSLNQNGYVPFIFIENNQTYNIKLVPLQDE